jgi:hypothetical protein
LSQEKKLIEDVMHSEPPYMSQSGRRVAHAVQTMSAIQIVSELGNAVFSATVFLCLLLLAISGAALESIAF